MGELSYFLFLKTSISNCIVVDTAGEFEKCTSEIDYSDMCDYDSSRSLEKKRCANSSSAPSVLPLLLYLKQSLNNTKPNFMIAIGRINLPMAELQAKDQFETMVFLTSFANHFKALHSHFFQAITDFGDGKFVLLLKQQARYS